MKDCPFCDIVAGKAPARKVHEDEHTLVFTDLNPVSLGHCLVISKQHVPLFTDIEPDSGLAGPFLKTVYAMARKIKKGLGCEVVSILARGYRVPHLHVHLVPGYKDDRNLLDVSLATLDWAQPRLKPQFTDKQLDEAVGKIKAAPVK